LANKCLQDSIAAAEVTQDRNQEAESAEKAAGACSGDETTRAGMRQIAEGPTDRMTDPNDKGRACVRPPEPQNCFDIARPFAAIGDPVI
jgi:hypothetical protein